MYSSFSIRNFRGISSLALTNLARVNLISGPNDVGKTAILEALFLHASGPFAGQLAIQVLRPARGQSGIDVSPSGEPPWNGFFKGFDAQHTVDLDGKYDDARYRISLSQPSIEQPVGLGKGDSAQQVWSSELHVEEQRATRSPQTYVTTITVQTASLPGMGGQQAVVQTRIDPHASRPFLAATFLSANRVTSVDLGAGYSSLRQQGRSQDLLDALKAVDERIKSLELLLSDGRPTLHALLSDNTLIPFPLMGDGISSIAGIILSMLGIRGGVLLVDEIENGLHHSVLKDLWHHIFRVARRLEVQVFAATHSHECVVAAHEALAGQPDALALIQLARGDDPSDAPTVAVYDIQTLGAGIQLDASLR